MSKHTSKYYQLVKILRAQKQMSKYQHMIRQQRVRLKNEKANMLVNQEGISGIIDQDNSKELDKEDVNILKKIEKLNDEQQKHGRLWEIYEHKSRIMRQSSGLLPMQQKINKLKDETLLDHILDDQDHLVDQKKLKLEHLCDDHSHTCEQLLVAKKQLDIYKARIEECDKDMIRLKADFDKEDKNLHERSNRFKEEKSKDIMTKNINKEDLQMRNVMMSRIKLNQELDFSFQLQRRKAFNQAKSGIAERKKAAQEQYSKQKVEVENFTKKEQQIEDQKSTMQDKIQLMNKQTIYFLKNIVKHFGTHSRGIKWVVDRLIRMNVALTKQDFPQDMSNQDKAFLQELFKQTVKYNPDGTSIFSQQKNYDPTVQDSSIASSRIAKKYRQVTPMSAKFKFDPNATAHNQYQSFMERTLLRPNNQRTRNKTMVYFDIDSVNQSEVRGRAISEIKHFNIESSSLKKIYKYTGEVIADRIKKNKWHYESCRDINFTSYDTDGLNDKKDIMMKQKLRSTYMNLRQTPKRNYLKKFVFGEQDKK